MRLKLAKFPVLKTIDNFDFSFQPEMDKDAIIALFSLRFVEEKANVILVGPSGVGKTHLAISLGIAACQGGYTCYFTSPKGILRIFKIYWKTCAKPKNRTD